MIVDYGEFQQAVGFICRWHSASVTSGWRTRKRNELVGGVAGSKHLDGMAVDLVLDDPVEHADLLQSCTRFGLKAIDEGDHIHVEVTR